jgi:hypothetical protein
MKTYHGIRSIGTADPSYVTVTGDDGVARPLTQPWCGFNWGADARRRSRPQRLVFELGADHLARVLLADATGDETTASQHCQVFKDTVVNQLGDDWSLTDAMVREWLLSQQEVATQ